MITIVTALVGGIVGTAVGGTTLATLIGALAALLSVVAGKFVFELVRYRVSGWKDPIWEAICDQSVKTGGVIFALECKVQPPEPIPGYVECAVKGPSGGVVEVRGSRLYREQRPPRVWFDHVPAEPGSYEVRWYALSDQRKLYEITRDTFEVRREPGPDSTMPLAERSASEVTPAGKRRQTAAAAVV